MFCRFCGTQLRDEAKFCHQCQQPVISTNVSDGQKKEAEQKANNNRDDYIPKKWEMDSPYGEVKDQRAQKMTKKHSRRSIGIGFATLALVLALVLLVTVLDFTPIKLISRLKGSPEYNPVKPSLETLMTASPFYTPELVIPSEIGKDHNKNVQNKMDEMIEITDEMMENYEKLKEVVYAQHLLIYELLESIDKEEGTDYIETSQVLLDLETLYASFELQELRYYSLEIDSTGEALYDSDIAFARIVSAMTACEKISEAYQQQLNFSSMLYLVYEDIDDKDIEDLLEQLKEAFEDDKADEYGATMMAGVDTINELMQSLDAANAILALSNLEYMEDELDDIKDDVEDLRESELVDEEFVELAELMVIDYEEMQGSLKDTIEAYLDEKDIELSYIPTNDKTNLFAPIVALAVSSDNKYRYGAGYDVQMLQKKGQEIMEAQRKAYQEKYKDESYWDTAVRTAKEFRKGVQDVTENVDAATFEFARTMAGKFTPSLGDKEADAYEDIQARYKLAQKRKEEGKGGEEVFKEAIDNFETVQNMAGEGWYNIAAFWEDELGLPEDSIAQIASQMGNIAAETFTQFGQGISRILDPNAKNSDIAKGCLEIATSMVGGSNNIFSATKSGGAVIAKMGEIIANPKITAKGVIDAIKAIKNIGLPQLGSSQFKNAAINGTMAIIKKSGKVTDKMIKHLDKTFTKNVTRIFTENWKKSLTGFREYINKVGGNVDDSAVKLIDEFVNGYIDNKVTELASQPWLWDPEMSDAEKEAKLGEEIDKMTEDLDKGLDNVVEQITQVSLDGTYSGHWTVEDMSGVAAGDFGMSQESVDLIYDQIGRSNPCNITVSGNNLKLTMIGDPYANSYEVENRESSTINMTIEIVDGNIVRAESPGMKVEAVSQNKDGKIIIVGGIEYEIIVEGINVFTGRVSFYGEK
jgi:hypothetical protein